MKKILLIIAMTVVGISAQAQLLWKVSGNGLQKPSYIFGTHHYAPLTVLDSVPQIRQVQNDVEQVCGEVDMLNTRDLPRLTAEAIMLPPGSSLALARDIFIFSFYAMGMPFVDIAYLRKEQVKDEHSDSEK